MGRFVQIQDQIKAIEVYGMSGRGIKEANSLQILSGYAQDGLALLRPMQFKLDLLGQQITLEEEAQFALKARKDQYKRQRLTSGELIKKRRDFFSKVKTSLLSADSIYWESTGILRKADSENKGHHPCGCRLAAYSPQSDASISSKVRKCILIILDGTTIYYTWRRLCM